MPGGSPGPAAGGAERRQSLTFTRPTHVCPALRPGTGLGLAATLPTQRGRAAVHARSAARVLRALDAIFTVLAHTHAHTHACAHRTPRPGDTPEHAPQQRRLLETERAKQAAGRPRGRDSRAARRRALGLPPLSRKWVAPGRRRLGSDSRRGHAFAAAASLPLTSLKGAGPVPPKVGAPTSQACHPLSDSTCTRKHAPCVAAAREGDHGALSY